MNGSRASMALGQEGSGCPRMRHPDESHKRKADIAACSDSPTRAGSYLKVHGYIYLGQ